MIYKRSAASLPGPVLAGSLPLPPIAEKKVVAHKKTSLVTYTMHHSLHTWYGVSHDINCALLYEETTKTIQSVAVTIKVASFDRKYGNRDSHAMGLLDGIRHPTVTFVSHAVQSGADGTLTATGKLTFHGVTKPTVLIGTQQDNGTQLTVSGAFDIKMSDFDVELPSLLGLKTDGLIRLTFVTFFTW